MAAALNPDECGELGADLDVQSTLLLLLLLLLLLGDVAFSIGDSSLAEWQLKLAASGRDRVDPPAASTERLSQEEAECNEEHLVVVVE